MRVERLAFWVEEQFPRTSLRNVDWLLRNAITWTLRNNHVVILFPGPYCPLFHPFTPLSHCLCEARSPLKSIFGFAAPFDGVLHLVVHLLDITTESSALAGPLSRSTKGKGCQAWLYYAEHFYYLPQLVELYVFGRDRHQRTRHTSPVTEGSCNDERTYERKASIGSKSRFTDFHR